MAGSSFLGAALGGFGGSVVGGAVVQLLLDDKQFQAGLAKAKGETQAGATGFSKYGAAAAAGFAVAGAAALKFAADSIGAALDKERAERRLANSVANSEEVAKDSTKAFIAQAEALRKLTAVDDESIMSAQSLLIQMHLTEQQVKSLTPLIVDLSVKMGVGLDQAAKAVGKAVAGNIGGLQRMGIIVDKTAAKTDSYAATLKALGVVQGFAEKEADAEPWKRMQSAMEELQESVGEALLPVIRNLADTMEQAIPVIEFFTDKLGELGPTADTGALGLTHLAAKFDLLPAPVKAALDAYGAYKEQADAIESQTNKALARSFEDLAPKFTVAGRALAEDFIPFLFDVPEAAQGATRQVRRFANLTTKELNDWRKATIDDLKAASLKIGGLGDDWKQTARETVQAARKMARDAQTIAADLDKLADIKAPDTFKKWLVDQGPGWVHGYVEATRGGKDQIESYWRDAANAVKTQKGALDDVMGKVDALAGAVRRLPSQKAIDIYVNVHASGISSTAEGQQVADKLAYALVKGQTG